MRRLLCYDITADRRRNRVFRRLKQYLEPVQKSVFEGQLPRRIMPRMLEMLARELNPTEDSVRIYSLCPKCAAAIQTIGTATPLPDPDAPIIIG